MTRIPLEGEGQATVPGVQAQPPSTGVSPPRAVLGEDVPSCIQLPGQPWRRFSVQIRPYDPQRCTRKQRNSQAAFLPRKAQNITGLAVGGRSLHSRCPSPATLAEIRRRVELLARHQQKARPLRLGPRRVFLHEWDIGASFRGRCSRNRRGRARPEPQKLDSAGYRRLSVLRECISRRFSWQHQ